ncbi:MAG: aldo/keto reductase [Lachnospiraceae bacterium]|nr:aldo/keto reductase [Lachnospiraceae bacterium]
MNIGLFTDTYYPELNGVANSVFLLKQELEKKGHNVYVITTKTPGAPASEKGVFRVPSKAWDPIPERRIGMVYHPRIAMQIHKMKLDIIHTHTEFSVGMFGRIMAHEMFIPVVHTYHTIYEDYTHYIKKYISSEKRARQFVKQFSKFSVRGAEELIVPTEKVARLMRRYGVKPDINVIPTGIDLKRFQVQDSEAAKLRLKLMLGIPREHKVVLYLGRVSEEKNIDELMEYFDHYVDRRQAVTFLIVGDGPYRSVLERMAKGKKHRKQIRFAGAKPWDEITHYYQLADVFVSASTSETQGLTYIEALASGLPVVARRDPCLDGVLFHEKNGFMFEDESTFIYGLEQVLYNRRKMDYRASALESVEQFSTEKFAGRIENIYFHVTQTHRNLLIRMANKVADRMGYEHTGIKRIGGRMTMNLGSSDMDASCIALGCMRIDALSLQEAGRLISTALELGVTLFDHADIYGDGRSEEIFGRILAENKGMRERMRIQTKCGIRDGFYDLSGAYLISSVEDSLKRLHTDYIDLFLLHRPDILMDIEDIADVFQQLERSGKVKQFGVSNFDSVQLELLQSVCRQSIVVNQIPFGRMQEGGLRPEPENHADRTYDIQGELAVLDYCHLKRITVQAYTPLLYDGSEGAFVTDDRFSKLDSVLTRLAQQYEVTPSAIVAAWFLRHPAGIQVMMGTTDPERLKEICRAVDISLSRREWYELYSAAGHPFP